MSDVSYHLPERAAGLGLDHIRPRPRQTPEPAQASRPASLLPTSAPAVQNNYPFCPGHDGGAALSLVPGSDTHDLLAIEPIDLLTTLLFGLVILACLAGWAGVGLALSGALGGLAS